MSTLIVLLLVAGAIFVWRRRPDTGPITLEMEHWDVVSDGLHNSNTDMVAWQGGLLLVHASSPWHLASTRSRLVLRHSRDGHTWETWATLGMPGRDIRDPKLAVIGGRLFLYALPNSGITATPTHTVLATSDDGRRWSDFEPVGPAGWLFWRPKSRDGVCWYVSAYWHEHGASRLFCSTDGRDWREVSRIHDGDGNDETAVEFLADGRLLATARLEVTPDAVRGNRNACTLIAVADPPYVAWEIHRSDVTRLDGPVLFRDDDGTLYAVARRQVGRRGPLTRLGGLLSRKRTAVYRVEPERLVHLSDLPSSGDTSYAGVVCRGDALFVDYYTSRIDRDWPWLLAMFLPTGIRMARIDLEALRARSRSVA